MDAVAAFLGYLPVPTKEERTPIQGREAPHVQKPLQGTKRSELAVQPAIEEDGQLALLIDSSS